MNLSPETACTFTIPRWRNRNQIKALVRTLKPLGAFKGIRGRVLYFDFGSSEEKDAFLDELQQKIELRGNTTERIDPIL